MPPFPPTTSRRGFGQSVLGLAGLGSWPAFAQNALSVRRIGWLEAAEEGKERTVQQMAALRESGWIEGRNLQVERRNAMGRLEKLFSLAQELVAAKVELLVADGPNPTRAAMRATGRIPIVFLVGTDPVTGGFVASLARPGGNATGFSATATIPKLLGFLKEASPSLQRLGVMEVSGNPQYDVLRNGIEASCRAAGIEPVFSRIVSISELETVAAGMTAKQVQALFLTPDSFTIRHRRLIIETFLAHGVPTVCGNPEFARDGALASYSVSDTEVSRRLAYFVDRILRGTKPADLPVEEPSRFYLLVNVKTARTARFAIPKALLLQADELIE